MKSFRDIHQITMELEYRINPLAFLHHIHLHNQCLVTNVQMLNASCC